MYKDDVTPKSEQEIEAPALDMSSVKESSSLVAHQPSPDSGAEPAPESEPAPTEAPRTETEEGKEKEEPKEEIPKEPTLEAKMQEEEVIPIKKVVHPKTSDKDLIFDGEKPEIRAQHTYDDIDKMFNMSGKVEKPNPKLFFSILKNDPDGADRIAKACGWNSAHYMKAAVEEYAKAKTPDEVLEVIKENGFPEFTWDSEADLPFEVKISSAEEAAEQQKSEGVYGYPKADMERAVNAYVADNDGVKKEDILKSTKVAKLLEEFSEFQQGGKQLSIDKALSLAIEQAGIKKEKLTKKETTSLGGGLNVKQPTPKKGPSEGAKRMAKNLGMSID